jgi:cellulose synthase A
MMEKEVKGTLIERLDHVEDRVLKLCVQLEYELDAAERKREDDPVKVGEEKRTRHKKKGLKQLVKQCVTGKKN